MSNYSSGSISVFQLNPDGSIEKKIYEESFNPGGGSKVDPARQEAAHAHQVTLFQNTAYVVNLGGDKIYTYRVVEDASSSVQIQKAAQFETDVGPGFGPRHLVVDSKRSRAYVINELKLIMSVFDLDPVTGALTKKKDIEYQIPDANPQTAQYGSEIEIHPDGDHLYLSHRGDGAILVFKIMGEDEGYLKVEQAVRTKGTWPRHFALSPSGEHLVSVDQHLNLMEVFKIGKEDGKLGKKTEVKCGEAPTVVTWI